MSKTNGCALGCPDTNLMHNISFEQLFAVQYDKFKTLNLDCAISFTRPLT